MPYGKAGLGRVSAEDGTVWEGHSQEQEWDSVRGRIQSTPRGGKPLKSVSRTLLVTKKQGHRAGIGLGECSSQENRTWMGPKPEDASELLSEELLQEVHAEPLSPTCWRRSSRRDVTGIGPWAGPRKSVASHPSLVLGMCVLPTFPTAGAISRTQLCESKVWLRPSGQFTGLTPVKTFIWTLKVLAGSTKILQPSKTKLTSSLLVKPDTYQSGWAASFFALWYGGPVYKPTLPSFYPAGILIQ